MPASVKHGLETISASDVMTGPQLLDALILTAPVILLGLALSWWGRKPYDRARHAADPTVTVDMDWLAERPVAVAARS